MCKTMRKQTLLNVIQWIKASSFWLDLGINLHRHLLIEFSVTVKYFSMIFFRSLIFLIILL